jgi:hypothetical protein
MTKSNKCKCPWCGKWILPATNYIERTTSDYRHCGRQWEIDDRGLMIHPIDLRSGAPINPFYDSKEINETPNP